MVDNQDWHLLLIDNDEDDYLLTRSLLRSNSGRKVTLDWASTFEEAYRCIQEHNYHAILVDYDLGSETGIMLIRDLAATDYPAPLILYTGRGSYEVDMEALQAGATMYLTKSEVTPLLLERSIRYAIERKQIEVELRASNERLAIELAERKRAEEEVRETQKKLQIIADFPHDWEEWRSPEGQFLYVSPSCERITGYTRNDFYQDPDLFLKIIHPDDREKVKHHLDMVKSEIAQTEFRIIRRDGQERWIGHVCQAVWDSSGRSLGRRGSNRDITERVQTEERLRMSKEQYSTLLNYMAEGVAIHEIITDDTGYPCDYRFLMVNPAFERLTGLASSEILGKRISEVFPGIEPYWIDIYGKVALTGEAVRFENYASTLRRWFDVFAFQTAPSQFAVIFHDITDRRKLEQTTKINPDQPYFRTVPSETIIERDTFLRNDLRQSGIDVLGTVPWGTHFCQFYNTSQDLVESLVPYFRAGLEENEFCMWITSAPLQVEEAKAALQTAVPDLDSRISNGQIEILDYTQWYTRTGRFDTEPVLQGWLDKLKTAQDRGFSGLRLSGNTFWLEEADWEDFKMYEEKINQVISGRPILALCTYAIDRCGFHEILDVINNHEFALVKNFGKWEIIESAGHTKMDLALRESEERLRLAVWAAKLGVFDWDMIQDKGLWENKRMYEIFGQPVQEGPLKKAQFLEKVVHPDDVPALEAAFQEGLKHGRLFEVVCRIRRQNDGELRWIELSGRFERDATGTPYCLRGVVEDITERKLVEKDLEEQNQRLQNYAEQLKQSNQALDEFAFIASHDLQEPLRKISAFGNLLKTRYSQQINAEGQDYIDRMQKASQRMEEMVKGLLAYARITTRSREVTEVDLSTVAAEVLMDLEERLLQTGGRVEIADLPVISANQLQMRQLFQNLLGNALKFRRPETPPLVKVSWEPASKDAVRLIFEDNGIGFDPKNANRLFKPFGRLHPKSSYEGTGLGLAICKKIVEQHGGTISVEGRPGKGSKFSVVLPVKNGGVPC